MRKILIVLVLVLVSGCNFIAQEKQVPNPPVEKITTNNYIKEQINILQKQIENREITEKYAQEKLKKILQENKKLNDGSIESILKKIAIDNPAAAKELEKRIRENHPEEFEN